MINNIINKVKGLIAYDTTPKELIVERFIKDNDVKSYAEIGVFKGKLFHHVLKHTDVKIAYAIDSWGENDYKDNFADGLSEVTTLLDAYETFCAGIRYKDWNRVKILKKNSIKASKEIENNSLDMIFIDADHRYKAVLDDLKHWYPKVRKGGIIAGHDYSINVFSVMMAVWKYFGTADNIKVGKDNTWWTIK